MRSEQKARFEQKERIQSKKQELREVRRELAAAKNAPGGRAEQVRGAKRKKLELIELQKELRALKEGRAVEQQTGALPDFVIIGSAKCGTTYLYHLLTQHPLVEPAAFKEPHFFNLLYDEGVEWYRRFFPLPRWENGRRTITGEATPGYITDLLVPERMAGVIPDARLVALLRNPVDRAYSGYQMAIRKEHETRTFEEVIGGDLTRGPVRFVSGGVYVDQLVRWTEFFPREQLLVLKSEDFFEYPVGILKIVLDFLGLPGWEPGPSELGERRNTGGYAEEMNPATRRRLEQYFEPHNKRLYEFLGTDFGW